MRILFAASLHHPQRLQEEIQRTPAGAVPPLFPTSMSLRFYEKAMRRRGYTLDVFWRNLSGFGSGDIASLKPDVHTERLTPQKIIRGLLHRLPAQANPDYRIRNQRLLTQARRFQPDVLWLVGGNSVIYPETVAAVKQETGCTVIYTNGTSPIVFSHAVERDAARLYDLVLVNDYYHGIQWIELGSKQMACLPYVAIDPEFHQPHPLSAEEQQQYACDITFVGTLVPYNLYSERVKALEALRDFNPGIWSVHDVPESLRPYFRGYALGDDMMRVLSAAKISLNTHGDFMRYGGNMRLFESAAVGAFQLVDNRDGIPEWFTPGEHLVIYEDLQDLREKAAYYLAHPEERARIVAAAREHVNAHHTYEQRLNAIESLLNSQPG